jgi:hypothetical protein
LTSVVISKGITGFALGYLWSRYRNLWLNVLIHTLLDALPLVLLVAGAALTISQDQTLNPINAEGANRARIVRMMKSARFSPLFALGWLV